MTFKEYIIKERSVYFLHLTMQDMKKSNATSLEEWLPNTYLEYTILKEYL